MNKSELSTEIQRTMAEATAADAADLFLSPHISTELLHVATYEPGPAMWVVNRSDVFDETLSHFLTHPDRGIARRAQDKLNARRSPPDTLAQPEPFVTGASEVPDFEVEEVLGHPRVELAAILHFSYALKAEHRASAALGATRRLLEYPPNWLDEDISRQRLTERLVQMLIDDPSALVRSYATRFPLLETEVISQALLTETNGTVRGRLLQHPRLSLASLTHAAEKSLSGEEDAFVDIILSLDSRLPRDLRLRLVASPNGQKLPYLAELCHFFQL
jgi:hypothetical protein